MDRTAMVNDDLPPDPKTLVLTVRRCPHCQTTHLALDFKPLARPTEKGHTHGARCRVTGRQILARKDKD